MLSDARKIHALALFSQMMEILLQFFMISNFYTVADYFERTQTSTLLSLISISKYNWHFIQNQL